jgi:hypothetical protein
MTLFFKFKIEDPGIGITKQYFFFNLPQLVQICSIWELGDFSI